MCPESKKDWDRYKNRALKSVKTGEELRLAMLHASSAGIDVMYYLPKIKFPDQTVTATAASNNLTAVTKMDPDEAVWPHFKNEFVSQEGTQKKATAKKPSAAKGAEKKAATKEAAAKKKGAAAKKKVAAGVAANPNQAATGTAAVNWNVQNGDHVEAMFNRLASGQPIQFNYDANPTILTMLTINANN